MKLGFLLPWGRRLRALEARVAALEKQLGESAWGLLGARADAAGVPLSRVINEYLYGEEESENEGG